MKNKQTNKPNKSGINLRKNRKNKKKSLWHLCDYSIQSKHVIPDNSNYP